MSVIALRTLAASAAAAVVVAALLFVLSTDDSAPAFGKVLDRVADAETLHLEITRQGTSGQLWAKRPNQLRWNHPDGTYRIARGERLWLVDEKANRATPQPSPYFRADRPGLDLLALLELPTEEHRKSLLGQRPAERVQRDGRECDVYRMEVPVPEGEIRIEAFVEADTQLLRSLEANADRGGRLEPIAKLTMLAFNQPVPEDLFVVGETLTADGRVGKVTDAQGIVSVKPVMHRRWTPVGGRLVLKPGDWVRTDTRGANAVSFRLVKQTDVTLGPGSLVEVVKPNLVRVLQGELKVVAGEKAPLEIIGPGGQKVEVKGTQLYRLDQEKLVRLEKQQYPLWLKGFEGATSNESIGSLVANVEQRNVPLTVGYHKVTVDIRDQIALTVIEESFVNHTDNRLEGVFHFPLPQDASISGFGMWIGDELVEADVVEKQRAREIYETMLREKQDPGLLEWSGGNIFKARVFPILPRSEKRIKISYTQVLPRTGNRYCYSYALQSEMLKQHPLRELSIDVKINSVTPLAGVTSPTHSTRTDQTRHSAHVEFSAQEYTPTRDFEVVAELEGRQSDVVIIPHRRGEDGYFMMQLTPPSEAGDWQREIVPDGEPLQLLILADTSASIDANGRLAQARFVGSLLGALTPQDTINLAACDVDCDWVFQKPLPADPKNIEAARQFLAGRASLGWTDLDKAFASALAQCGPRTRVIYVGDGIATTGDADPVAFSKRLRRLYQGNKGTFHAVSVGSSFEPLVLSTIASLGGGSVRQISGQRGPQAVALELLGEIARPAVRDLKVEFRGLRTARVYPEQLPNLSAGCQQILLGRYLPEGRDQAGEVIVTGARGGKPVSFRSRVSLKDAEKGNSFIPRLWARMHLDSLLQQGASSAIKDEIIALSEEYHIMTPYTSLLVLESDADRERFKVKRRFQMRDGEKFFAEGRDTADYELVQQQMKRAGNWRLGLRRTVLRQLMALGRDAEMLQPQRYPGPISSYGYSHGYAGGGGGGFSHRLGGAGFGGDLWFGNSLDVDRNGRSWNWDVTNGLVDLGRNGWLEGDFKERFVLDGDEIGGEFIESEGLDSPFGLDAEDSYLAGEPLEELEPYFTPPATSAAPMFLGVEDDFGVPRSSLSMGPTYSFVSTGLGLSHRDFRGELHWPGHYPAQYTQWLSTLFPHLPPPPTEVKAQKPWPANAQALAKSLLRTEQLAKLKGGLRIELTSEGFDVRWDELSSRHQTLALVSPKAWLSRSGGFGSQTIVSFCDARERGVFSEAFWLGRLRTATERDLNKPPLSLYGHVLTRLDHTYQNYSVELKPRGDGQTSLVLKQLSDPNDEIRVLIDTAREVILSIENYRRGERTSATTFDQFVEVAGGWWAGRIQTTDKEGRRTGLTTQTFKLLDADAFERQMSRQLAGRQKVQFLHEPLVKLVDAKRALGAGKADFDDHLALLLHFCGSQQWDRVREHLEQTERLAAGKPGIRWVRYAILHLSRRREELKKRFLAEAVQLAAPHGADSEELFIANYLLGQAGGVFEANEMLALLETLKPVYQRQPPYLTTVKSWKQQRVDYLQNTGQADEALRLQRQLAEEYPRDCDAQRQYAYALSRAGEYAAAYAWLDRVLGADARWLPREEDSLRDTYADLLRQQGRYPELVDFLAEWVKLNPGGISAYQQYLSALIRTDRVDEANGLIAGWLKEGRTPGPPKPQAASRLQAAVAQALGQGYDMHTDRIDERWLTPLAETALYFARHESQFQIADRIMGHGQFRQSDECRRVRKAVTGILTAELDRLPAGQVQRFVDWIWPNDPAVEAAVWKRIAAGLQRRWSAESDPKVKHQLARPLVRVLSGRAGAVEYLAFLRLQLQEGPQQYRADYANELFDALLGQPWSAKHEDEAFGLLERLSEAEDPAQRLQAQVGALYRLTDAMVESRFAARMGKVEHQEELTRTELGSKKAENLRLARQGVADSLRGQIPEHSGPLGGWLNIERLYLDTLLERNLDKVEQECWEFLGPEPRKLTTEQEPQLRLEEVLRNRFLLTLANLAARKGAEPRLIDRLLKYLDEAIAADAEDLRWKLFKYQLLIALDRPTDLEQSLRAWVRSDEPDSRWRLSLGYLLAEQGRIGEAIRHFEAVETADEFGPSDYRALADWYMVVDRRDQHDRALVSMYKTMQEWRMSNWLSAKLDPWNRGQGELPSELDKNVLLVFAAIFEKSGHPQNYLWQLREFYQATHDFRLLTGLADAVIGHTAAKVYPFLQGMGSVLSEVRDEATADSIVEHLGRVRQRATTNVDHRALDLLELQVERRCAELLNQPGPHVDAALAAMQRAFKRQWTSGEPRLMADFLAGLGRISQSKLADEQLRQLEVLHRQAAQGSVDRLHIAHRLANGLWSYDRADEAIDLLQAALDEFQNASGGVLPREANDPLDTFVSYLEGRGHHARGEQVLLDQLKHPVNRQQTFWLIQRLYQLYENALRNDGDVSLGTGSVLYRAVERKIQGDLDTDDHNHRYALVSRLCTVYKTAHDKRMPAVADDLRAFAFKRLPEVLKRQTVNHQSIVDMVARKLHDLASPRDGLAFVIERMEEEPRWFRYNNQDGWSHHGWKLGQWRREVTNLGDLEDRLLQIVTAELRWDLQSRQQRNRNMYHCDNSRFWAEKEDAFAQTAEEVLAERKQSGAAVQYVADYLFHGLRHYNRAVEILLVAHNQELLDEAGQSKLAQFLQHQERYGESVAVLQPLVKRRPDEMEYRVWLMRAYFHTKRQEQLLTLLKQTDEYFHQEGRWTEDAIASLAESCLENQLYQRSVDYYNELIPLHQRTRPRRGIGGGTLSSYYGYMSQAYAGLKKTTEAVDAACGAIVSWGPKHEKRAEALEALKGVLRRAPDLDGYVAGLDQQTVKTGRHNPILRKALGQIYLEKRQYPEAIAQLQLACELQPNDTETHQALIDCYDKQEDEEGAIGQLLELRQLTPRDIGLYKRLADRLKSVGRPGETERAYSSIVEVLPSESESHTMLAEIRQQQDRWDEAIVHWEQVARIRALEPTGLLKLAAAQIRQQQWEQATETLRKLSARGWPSRFGDVYSQVRDLERQIDKRRKM